MGRRNRSGNTWIRTTIREPHEYGSKYTTVSGYDRHGDLKKRFRIKHKSGAKAGVW